MINKFALELKKETKMQYYSEVGVLLSVQPEVYS